MDETNLQVQEKGLVLICDVNSPLAVEVARRFNDLFYPVLVIGDDQNFLDAIEYSHPEIAASIEGKASDQELLLEALDQVEPVFGKLAKIIVTSNVDQEISTQEYKKLPEADNFTNLINSKIYQMRFTLERLKAASLTYIANFIPENNFGQELNYGSVNWDLYFNNFELLDINPTDQEFNPANRINLGNLFAVDLIGRPPYDNQLAAVLTEKVADYLPPHPDIRFVRIMLDQSQMTVNNPSPIEIRDIQSMPADNPISESKITSGLIGKKSRPTMLTRVNKFMTGDSTDGDTNPQAVEQSQISEPVAAVQVEKEPEPVEYLNPVIETPNFDFSQPNPKLDTDIEMAEFVTKPQIPILTLDDLVTDKNKKPGRKTRATKNVQNTQADLEKLPSDVEELNSAVNEFSTFVDKMSATLSRNQEKNQKKAQAESKDVEAEIAKKTEKITKKAKTTKSPKSPRKTKSPKSK